MTFNRPTAYIALVAFAASAAAVLVAVAASSGVTTVMLVFLVAAAALEASPARVNPDTMASLAVLAEIVAVAYGGLPVAVFAALGTGVISARLATSGRAVKSTYNTGMFVLCAASAAVVFEAVVGAGLFAPDQGIVLSDHVRLIIGLLLAGLAYTAVNTTMMAAIVNVTSGLPFLSTLRNLVGQFLILQFLYVGLAAIAYVLLAKVGWPALALLAVPLLVARRSLQSVQARQEAFDRMVRAFVKAIEVKDGYTRGHAERVADLSVQVAERMGLSYDERQLIRYGALLHDVGKIGVSLGVLCKAGPLTDAEFDEMKLHPEIGAEMLDDIDFLEPALAIIHHHHERIDGRGYPDGLTGDQLPLLTRVVTAVDAFDAMTSTRSYRRALPVEVALAELQAHAGTQFDPEVVDHLVAVVAHRGWEITDVPVQAVGAGAGVST